VFASASLRCIVTKNLLFKIPLCTAGKCISFLKHECKRSGKCRIFFLENRTQNLLRTRIQAVKTCSLQNYSLRPKLIQCTLLARTFLTLTSESLKLHQLFRHWQKDIRTAQLLPYLLRVCNVTVTYGKGKTDLGRFQYLQCFFSKGCAENPWTLEKLFSTQKMSVYR